MERNFYTEGFESFLKDKSDQYKLYPSDKVWKNINRKLHPKRRWPYLAAALLLLGVGVGGKFYLDDKAVSKTQPSEKIENNSPGVNKIAENQNSQNPVADQNLQITETKTNNPASISAAGSQLRVVYKNPDLVTEHNLSEADEFNRNSVPVISAPDISVFNETDETIINSPDLLTFRPLATIGSNLSSSLEKKSVTVINKKEEEENLSLTQKLVHELKKVRKKTGWEFHVAPSVSYRRLIGNASDLPFNYSGGTMYNTNTPTGTDVSQAVHHTPLTGFETGASLVYPLTKNLRVRAGMQFNYNRYEIKAYTYKPEMASFGVDYSGANARSINTISYYRNYSGNSLTKLRNERFMVSVPLGVELTLFGNDRVTFNVASTIQPTYIFDNNSFLISTNLKNYAQEPRLYRNWNVNAGLEAFLSVKTGTVNWVVGPQFRYQVLSSYKDNYPISEHLVDYGLKIGVVKPIR